ncbi:hypothetical protein MRB53_032067 [Persea americana]|uniref:Uncharacterized protein n=1 Tax=Persea americana TaxID=3435 RepID=A0ACC2KR39_PERAE|nr:hypothetical protein MRB53_032067 [Persea americana]
MDDREEAIPVTIDLDQFPAQSGKLVEACEGLGCFRVVNHKIPLPLMSEIKSVVRSLLDLPAETKLRNTDTIAGSGYVGPTPKNPLYEALGLYDINSSEAVDSFCDQLDATIHQRFLTFHHIRSSYYIRPDSDLISPSSNLLPFFYQTLVYFL